MDRNTNPDPALQFLKPEQAPGSETAKELQRFPETIQDEQFTLKISEDMALRNLLRSGLVEAQGKDGNLIPMFVSWPHWLEDGIVCLYAKDFQRVINDAMKEMATALESEFNIGESGTDNEPDQTA